MDENNNYNNSPYGSNYQQPYVPKHEKPSSESGFGGGMQGINEPDRYQQPSTVRRRITTGLSGTDTGSAAAIIQQRAA